MPPLKLAGPRKPTAETDAPVARPEHTAHRDLNTAAIRNGAADRLKMLIGELRMELVKAPTDLDGEFGATVAILKEILDA